jgi:OOP family OmpA-OmpF porin
MHIQRKSRLIVAGLLASVAMAGCAPKVFADTSGLAIVGTAAPVEAEPPPPEPQKRVEVRENKIIINEKIQFLVNSDKILEVSHSLLDEVAKVIKDHPQIKKIEVEGHASAEGSDAKNLNLSNRRAKAVMKYLTKTGGITTGVLSAKGYGETRPIADNETEDGREKNRRVEFTITEQDVVQTKVEVDDKGNEKVVSGG